MQDQYEKELKDMTTDAKDQKKRADKNLERVKEEAAQEKKRLEEEVKELKDKMQRNDRERKSVQRRHQQQLNFLNQKHEEEKKAMNDIPASPTNPNTANSNSNSSLKVIEKKSSVKSISNIVDQRAKQSQNITKELICESIAQEAEVILNQIDEKD